MRVLDEAQAVAEGIAHGGHLDAFADLRQWIEGRCARGDEPLDLGSDVAHPQSGCAPASPGVASGSRPRSKPPMAKPT
jgi:hypothetical protein